MARPTADTAQITFRLPLKWLERADAVAAALALAGRPMGRTDGVRALIAAGMVVYSDEVGKLTDLVARDLQAAAGGGPPITREEVIRVTLEKYVASYVAAAPSLKVLSSKQKVSKRKTNSKRARRTK